MREPMELRRWLQPRVRSKKLYQLAPTKPVRKGLGVLDSWDHLRVYVRAWWIWLATALVLFQTGAWYAALVAGVIAFVLYHTAPHSHPAVYALEPDFGASSDEFRITMAGTTGIPLVDRNLVNIYNNGVSSNLPCWRPLSAPSSRSRWSSTSSVMA